MPLTQPADSTAPGRSEEWVQESRNLPEWKRLQAALNLAEGFEFLPVATEDVAAEELLGRLLERHANEKGVTLRGFDLSTPPEGKHLVTAILDEVEQAPRPCWFWFRGGKRTKAEEAELGHLFLLLNQKRDVISQRADAPFIFVLHPFDWKVFRRNAPDFWSIHHAVFRFGPGTRPEALTRGVSLELGIGIAARPSRGPHWRMEMGTESESGSDEFVGRTSEIRQLTAVLLERGARLLVTGPGGIGKTSLVREVVPAVAARYSEGVWWVPFADLPGDFKDRAAAALTGILGDLLPFVAAPPDLKSLAQLFRSATDSSARLFVFDDVNDAKAIEWLIPGKSASVVVTSRSSRPSQGHIEQLQLGALTEADAVALLRRIVPRIGDQAAEVARLCGYLPLALRLAAGALASQPDLSPTELIHGLNDGGKPPNSSSRDVSLAASINLSLTALPIALRARYRQLGIFSGNFDASAAAAVWGSTLEQTEAENALQAFALRALLASWDGRYELHPFARSIAWSQLADEEKSLAGLRHAEHLCKSLRRANGIYQEDTKRQTEGLALFDLEAHQIRAGQTWTAANLEVREAAAHLASEYPMAGGQVIQLRLSPRELIRWLEVGLAGARKTSDRKMEGRHLGNLGFSYFEIGDPLQAIEYFEQQLVISREIGDRPNELNAIASLGTVYAGLGEMQKAIAFLEPYRAVAAETGNRRGERHVLGNLGNAYASLGETRKAIDFFEQARAIDREIGDRSSEATDLDNLGNAYASLGEHQRAVDFYEQALAAEREISNRRGEAIVLGNLGHAYSSLGESRRAIDLFGEAISVSREIGDRTGESIALVNLGHAYTALGETRRAIDSYEKALGISREIGDRIREGRILGNLGVASTASGELQRATTFFEQQLVLAREISDKRGEATASWNLGVVYRQLGELPHAIELMQESVDYEREIGHPDAERDAEKVEEIRMQLENVGEDAGGPRKSE